MRVTDLLALSHVPRWTIVSHSRPQSVADHSFRVCVIAVELAERLGVQLSADALLACLYHDGPESRSGDIPSGAKRRIEDKLKGSLDDLFWPSTRLKGSTVAREVNILMLADKIEGYTFIQKWGVGPHAAEVADACHAEVTNLISKTFSGKESIIQDLVGDILTEKGRLTR